MNAFGTLFLRDVKKIGAVYAPVILGWLALCASIRWLFPLSFNARINLTDLCFLLLFAAPPLLLSRSFTDESLVKSDQQWFSLPLRRSTVVLSRVFTVLLFLAISAVAAFLWSLLMVPVQIKQMEEACRRAGTNDYAKLIPYYHDFWGFLFHMSRYFFLTALFALCSFVLLGLVILTQSFRYTIRRYNSFLRNLTVLALFIFFCWLGFRGMHFSGSELDTGSIVNSLIAGVVFLAIGLIIFDRTAEV